MGVNLDKPHLWKEDIARSVDLYNDWFLAMLERTNHLRNLAPEELRNDPSILFALRMSTAPPIARDPMVAMRKFLKSRIELQEELDTAKTQEERNRLGQFSTQETLASDIVAYALSLLQSPERIHFLEPAFGTGPFYSALLSQAPDSHIETAVGYEIDPQLRRTGKKALA
jgi:hypothetical protein